MTSDSGTPTRSPNRRKVREGLVVSTEMDKTAVVAVIERVRHPRYAKTVQRTKRLYAHDPANDVRVGDRVRLQETRPLSKLKHWRIIDVLERDLDALSDILVWEYCNSGGRPLTKAQTEDFSWKAYSELLVRFTWKDYPEIDNM